jgi:hypothetical protein
MANKNCTDDQGIYNGLGFLELTGPGIANIVWVPNANQLVPLLKAVVEVPKCMKT